MCVLIATAAMLLWFPSSASAQGYSIDDFALHISITDPQISPDQRRVAYVRTFATQDFSYRYEIVVADLVGAGREVITVPSQFAHHPRWASNDALSFLALAEEGRLQVFVADLDKGATEQITHHADGVQGFTWSPDKSRIVFASRPKHVPSPIKAFKVGKFSISPPKPKQQLTILSVESGRIRLLAGAHPVVDRWSRVEWNPQGTKLIYREKNPQHFDEYSDLLVEYDVANERLRRIGQGAYPQYNPGGDQVLYLARETPDYAVGPRKAYVLDLETMHTHQVAPLLDREVLGRFTPDGQILLNGSEIDAQRLWVADSDRVVRLDTGDVEPIWPLHASWVGHTLAFVGASPARAQELYIYRDAKLSRITAENDKISNRARATVLPINWQAPDDLNIYSVALLPPHAEEGARYPLILSPHGGPHRTSTRAEVTGNLINQSMASKGWIVLSPNYRGSTNLGREFHMLRFRNPDYDQDVIQDVIRGIDALDEQCRCVDRSRIAILGTSYGGKVAAWATALHPELWRAAVIGNANLDDTDMYALSDRGPGVAARLGSVPWGAEAAEIYRNASPIYAADKVRTPTLILSTLRDPRVPVISSFKYWKALEHNGTEVEFVAYDTNGHGPSDLANSMDYWKRAVAWIEQHFVSVD